MLIIDNPPLISFRIDFKFKKPEKITFEEMAKVEEVLRRDYPNVPNLNIIEYPFDAQAQVEIPIQIGPIKFLNEKKSGQIQFFSDGLIFLFTEYSHWDDIKEKIIKILYESCNIIKVEKIEQFRIEYIDEFILKKEKFNLHDYFNLNVIKPETWAIDYTDFHIGIKIITLNTDKFIIRLRGLPPKQSDKFLFRLESIYLKKKMCLIVNKEELLSELNLIHDLITEYFKSIMSEKLKEILGVREA